MRRRGSLCGEWAVGVEGVWQRGLVGKSRPCLEWKSCPVCQSKQLGGQGVATGVGKAFGAHGGGCAGRLKEVAHVLLQLCACWARRGFGKGRGIEALGLGARAEVGGGLAVG